MMICSICDDIIDDGYGNNAEPVNDGRCCNLCNEVFVIRRRIFDMVMDKGEE